MSGSLQDLSNLLENLQSNHSLRLAAVVGLDGLVIDAASADGVDAEGLAAVAAPGLLIMTELGAELGEERLAQLTTLEYPGHVVILMPLNDDALLVAVAEAGSMNLGQLRIVLRRSAEHFSAALTRI